MAESYSIFAVVVVVVSAASFELNMSRGESSLSEALADFLRSRESKETKAFLGRWRACWPRKCGWRWNFHPYQHFCVLLVSSLVGILFHHKHISHCASTERVEKLITAIQSHALLSSTAVIDHLQSLFFAHWSNLPLSAETGWAAPVGGTVCGHNRRKHETRQGTHRPWTGCHRPPGRLYARWGRRCSSPSMRWAPPAGGGRSPLRSPPWRSSTPGWGCRGRRRSVRTAPAWRWCGSPRPSPGRSSGGRCRRTRACPSAIPAANRAWRSPRKRRRRTAGRAGPRSRPCTSGWMPWYDSDRAFHTVTDLRGRCFLGFLFAVFGSVTVSWSCAQALNTASVHLLKDSGSLLAEWQETSRLSHDVKQQQEKKPSMGTSNRVCAVKGNPDNPTFVFWSLKKAADSLSENKL